MPDIEGLKKEGIFLIKKDRNYLMDLKEKANKAKRIIIIGGGYIGVEVADELLNDRQKHVTVIEKLDSLLPVSMDPEFGAIAKQEIENLEGEVILGVTVERINGTKNVEKVLLSNKKVLPADMVIIACGYKPNTELAQMFDLVTDDKHGILVDEYLRSSEKGIFAIGDCAAKFDFFTGEFSNIMLASTAMAEGRLVGSNLFSIKVIRKYLGVLGSFSTKIGDIAFGASGLTETKAVDMGLDYTIGTAKTVDRHPGKLPGTTETYIKLIFSRYSHTLLGAQVYGGDSVGELVNMLSVMILNKMTDMDIDNLQIGTHPLLTASPIAYPVINATTNAIAKWYHYEAVESSSNFL
jgi:NADH oxidase (H2O2-forming)